MITITDDEIDSLMTGPTADLKTAIEALDQLAFGKVRVLKSDSDNLECLLLNAWCAGRLSVKDPK